MPKLQYYPVERKDPVTRIPKFYPQKISYSNIGPDQLVTRIVANTGIPQAAVNAAISAITDSVINFVLNGHSVQIGDIMSIRPTVSSWPSLTKEAVKASNVKKLNFRVAWGSGIKNLQDPKIYEFERRGSSQINQDDAELAREEKEEEEKVIKKVTKKK